MEHVHCSICNLGASFEVYRAKQWEPLCEDHLLWLMDNTRADYMPQFRRRKRCCTARFDAIESQSDSYNKRYYAQNRGKFIGYSRDYYARNREKISERRANRRNAVVTALLNQSL